MGRLLRLIQQEYRVGMRWTLRSRDATDRASDRLLPLRRRFAFQLIQQRDLFGRLCGRSDRRYA